MSLHLVRVTKCLSLHLCNKKRVFQSHWICLWPDGEKDIAVVGNLSLFLTKIFPAGVSNRASSPGLGRRSVDARQGGHCCVPPTHYS